MVVTPDALLHGRRQPPAAVRVAVALLLAAGLLAGVGCTDQGTAPPPVAEGAIPAGKTIGSASITGTVRYDGDAPRRPVIDMRSDAACHGGRGARREDLIVGPEGGLANVFVTVVSGLGERVFAPPPEAVRLEQRGCVYRPHVLGVQAGQPLVVANEDPTLHNVHAVASVNPGFNFGMAFQGQSVTRYFARPELMIRIKCDVHPWMGAWIGVTDHPFHQVTDPDGRFTLAGLPAGDFVIEAWHETLGTQRRAVRLGEGEGAEMTMTFPAP